MILPIVAPATSDARVVRLVVEQKRVIADGKSWGNVGPYERLDGRPLVYASLGTLQGSKIGLFRAIAEACAPLPVQLVVAGSERLAGVLRAVGDDVATVGLDGDAGAAYVSLSAVRLVLRSG